MTSAIEFIEASGFLLASTDRGDPTWAIDEVVEDLGPDTVAYLRHFGSYYKYVGYAAECKLAGFNVNPIQIQTFSGVCANVLPHLEDPLCLTPGDSEILGSLVYRYEVVRKAA